MLSLKQSEKIKTIYREPVLDSRHMDSLYKLIELQMKGTPFEGWLTGSEIYRFSCVLDRKFGDASEIDRYDYSILLSLVQEGVPADTVILAYGRMADDFSSLL